MKLVIAVLVACVGSVLVSMSSLYIALKLGALPWPTVFAALAAYAVLRLFRQNDIHAANCVQAAISAGGLVAGGIAFTLPALWVADGGAEISFFKVCCLALSGAFIGWFFAALLRRELLEAQELPFPMGQAAADALKSSSSGAGAATLFGTMAAAAVFTFLRDGARLFQAVVVVPVRAAVAGFWLSPMALGVGYIIGPALCGWWAAGTVAVILWSAFVVAGDPALVKNSVGIGLITGGGIGTIFVNLQFKSIRLKKTVYGKKILLLPIAAVLMLAGGISWQAAAVFLLVAFIVCRLAAQLTGQTAINPMDLLGLMSVLIVVAVTQMPFREMILVAAVAAVSCAVAGDTLQDLKSGLIIGTSQSAQLKFALFGAVTGAIVSSFVLLNLHSTFGAFGDGREFVAPQACAIAAMLSGNFQPAVFYTAALAGVLTVLAGVPAIFIGLGIYLPVPLSCTIVTGGIINYIVKRFYRTADVRVQQIAAGCLGGEGIAGVLYALWRSLHG